MSQDKVLAFPQQVSLGDVFLLNGGVPRYLGQAQGPLSIPNEAKVKLVIGIDGAGQANHIANLNEDDLYALSLYSMKINLEVFPLLSNLKGLRELDLGKVKLVRRTSTAASIDVAGQANDMDKVLGFVRELKELRVLTMPYTNVTDEGMANLSGLKFLEVLDLEGNSVTDKGLSAISALNLLRVIDLEDNKITDEGLALLKNMSRLEVLDVEGTDITDQGLSYLSELNNLRWIRLRGTKITDNGIMHLKGLANLKMIEMQDTAVTDKTIDQIVQMPQLEEVDFSGSSVTAAGLNKLKAGLPNCKINVD